MIALMREASETEIMPRFRKALATDKQGGDFYDPVTEADLKASQYILDRIRPDFPGSYSEEHKHADRFDYDLIWQLDPVDGTHEFVEGIQDGFAMHAALLQRQSNDKFKSVAGIVYLPGVDKLCYTDGSGEVFLEIEGQRTPVAKPDRSEIRGFIRGVDPCKTLPGNYQKLGKALNIPAREIPCGGAGAGLMAMLEGQINLLIFSFNYSKEWDIAMLDPIIKALGGFVCDADGHDFPYNRPDDKYGEPYNLRGAILSYSFTKEEIISNVSSHLIVDRLK